MNLRTATVVFEPQTITRFDINGPRYTSYPTADRFVDAFPAERCRHWLGERGAASASGQPLSLYFHIPFCNTICYYCACNKIITKDHGRSAKYLKYLARELDLQSSCLAPEDRTVAQLHWGGGTPTFLSHDEMRQLMAATRRHFRLIDEGEYSIEVEKSREQLGRCKTFIFCHFPHDRERARRVEVIVDVLNEILVPTCRNPLRLFIFY